MADVAANNDDDRNEDKLAENLELFDRLLTVVTAETETTSGLLATSGNDLKQLMAIPIDYDVTGNGGGAITSVEGKCG